MNTMRTEETTGARSEASALSAGAALGKALGIFLFLSAVLGLGYPALVTGVAQLVVPESSNGSVVRVDGRPAGSRLIGQNWTDSGLFEGRPSAVDYNAKGSSGSNLAMTNPELARLMTERAERWQRLTGSAVPVPAELLTASGSGLDPDISLSAALYQIPRVARTSGLAPERLEALVRETAREPFLAMGPEPLVNVLELNLRVADAAGKTLESFATHEATAAREASRPSEPSEPLDGVDSTVDGS